jgi:hypothetical protein
MYGGMDAKRIVSHIFHDVDLAAFGPAHGGSVGSHHPNGRPGPFSGGYLGANLDTATEKFHFAQGVDAGATVREAAKLINGGGGGQKHYAMAGGKNPEGLQAAVDKAVEIIMEKLK